MGMSRRARRGIAVFNKIQTSPNRLRYMMRRMMIEVPKLAANILQAAQAAAEAINASVQIVPKSENNPVAADQERGAEQHIPVQPEVVEKAPEGTPGGPQ